MTEGMPANSSTAGFTMAAKDLGATSARNTAVSTPMGTPSKIARVVPMMEVRITHRIPNFGSAAVGIHSVPNRISPRPTFKMEGVPLMIIYKVMETTASTAKRAQMVNTICATVSTTALFFLFPITEACVPLFIAFFPFFCVRLLLYSDQTNFGSNLLSFVTQYKVEPCLYQIVLLGDFTLGSHYERSA